MLNFRNPSVEGDTPFKSSTSSKDIFCQEIDNNKESRILTDITDQHHYDTWQEVEKLAPQKVKNYQNINRERGRY